jgi:uncharacterized membrane protein
MVSADAAQTPLRSGRERLLQTLAYEAGGLLLVAPLFAQASASALDDSFALLALLSVVVMGWAAVFNTLVDRFEARHLRRSASQRSAAARVAHALALEGGAVLLTWPIIHALSDLGWLASLGADLALTAAYAVYGYAFHLVFDRLRPVRSAV